MRLHSVTLANFKSFAGEVEIPIGQITYLVGPNGAGKSNILEGVQKIGSMILNNKHISRPSEFFNNDDETDMKLGATFELSDEEQLAFFLYWTKAMGTTQADPGADLPFRFLKCVATLDLGMIIRGEIWISTRRRNFEQLVCCRRDGNQFILDSRDREKPRSRNTLLPPIDSKTRDSPVLLGDLFSLVDSSLLTKIGALFKGMKVIGTNRKISSAVTVHESDKISPTGQNLPNELNDLPRAEQDEFDGYMAPVTHGDPAGVEPRTIDSNLVLDVREEHLSRRTTHTDLGSGQLQTLILGWQMFRQEGVIIVLKEPEMHLHAERQKQVLSLIKGRSEKDNIQFIIETHSPVFLGAGPDERTILVTKNNGRSSIAEIGPDRVDLIRHELGITHTDALRADNLVLAEESTDLAVLAPLLRFPYSEHPFSTQVCSMHDTSNSKSLKMLVRYLQSDNHRRIFVVLDGNSGSERKIKELENAGLLSANFCLEKRDSGDGLGDELIVKAASEMASESGCDFQMTAGDLRESRRRGKAVIAALKMRWNEEQCCALDAARLAGRIIGLHGGVIPRGIEETIRVAAAYFEEDDCGSGTRPDKWGASAGV